MAVCTICIILMSTIFAYAGFKQRLLTGPRICVDDFHSTLLCVGLTGELAGLLACVVTVVYVLLPADAPQVHKWPFLGLVYIIILVSCLIATLLLRASPRDTGSRKTSRRSMPSPNPGPTPNPPTGELYHPTRFHILLALARPVPAFLTTLPTLASGAAYESAGLAFWGVRSLPLAMVVMAGFVLNDIGDMVKDRTAAVYKPLASGHVTKRLAASIACLLICGAVLIECLFPGNAGLMTVISAALGVTLYTPISHRMPLFKGPMTAALCCLSLTYADELTSTTIPMVDYAILAMFVVGRELLLDVRDRLPDRAYGLSTWAHVLGDKAATAVGQAGMLAGALGLWATHSGGRTVWPALALALTILGGWAYHQRTALFSLASRAALAAGALGIVLGR